MRFKDLPKLIQEELSKRYSYHGINDDQVENAFNTFLDKFDNYDDLDPTAFLKMSVDDMKTFISADYKEMSHIFPVSKFESLKSSPNNIIIEDKFENRERSDEIMSSDEEEAALRDFVEDIHDGDIDDDGIVDLKNALIDEDRNSELLDIIGLSLPIGVVLSGVNVLNKLQKDEIELYEVPKEAMVDVGKKSVKVAIIGTMITSGSPIIVGLSIAYIFYGNKSIFDKLIAKENWMKNKPKKYEIDFDKIEVEESPSLLRAIKNLGTSIKNGSQSLTLSLKYHMISQWDKGKNK